jgi:hypothetical protein
LSKYGNLNVFSPHNVATLGHFFPRKGFVLIALAFFLSPECKNSPKTETLQVTHLIELGKGYT